MNKTEKQFFKAFDIEPRDNFKGCENGITFYTYGCNMPSCRGCSKEIREKEYPQITDRLLLKLICILTAWHLDQREPYEMTGYNVERLKRQVLEDCIEHKEKFRNKVQALFKEDN